MSRTTIAGLAAGPLLALFGFLGAEPVSWPRAVVLVAGCAAVVALGYFARDHGPVATPDPALPASTTKRPEADAPAKVGP
jgi:peptidoglycan/LPS O-acetylase OafA/YrhL